MIGDNTRQQPAQFSLLTRGNPAGFTLVEILVAMAIFTTALVATAGIFTYTNRSQQKTQQLQDAQSSARFAMEVMSQMIRRSSVDYAAAAYADGVPEPADVLALLSNTGDTIIFTREVVDGRGMLTIAINGAASEPLTPANLSVEVAQFYISPITNPFSANPTSNQQPRVTIVLTTRQADTAEALTPTYMQTTVSSRAYIR